MRVVDALERSACCPPPAPTVDPLEAFDGHLMSCEAKYQLSFLGLSRRFTLLSLSVRWLKTDATAEHHDPHGTLCEDTYVHLWSHLAFKGSRNIDFHHRYSVITSIYPSNYASAPSKFRHPAPLICKDPPRSRQAMRDGFILARDCCMRFHQLFAQSQHHPTLTQCG